MRRICSDHGVEDDTLGSGRAVRSRGHGAGFVLAEQSYEIMKLYARGIGGERGGRDQDVRRSKVLKEVGYAAADGYRDDNVPGPFCTRVGFFEG